MLARTMAFLWLGRRVLSSGSPTIKVYLWGWFHLLFPLGSCGLLSTSLSFCLSFLVTLFSLVFIRSLLPSSLPSIPLSFLEYKLSFIIPALLIHRISWWKLIIHHLTPETLIYLSVDSGILKSFYLWRLKSIEFVGLLKFNLYVWCQK